ncbi:MAG: winged helix-turn-helix domain-containing protein [Solirubrobacteraceae bacterium]
MHGDADIAKIGALVADAARARILLSLGDGRALAASVLADEAGIAASTASSHLQKLVDGGLLTAQRHGRHRYFALAGADVGELIEALARLAPPAEVRSLRQGTAAHAVRRARTCYDHLAGMLGTGLMQSLLDRGLLAGGDGRFYPTAARRDRLSAPGSDLDYRVTERGVAELGAFGIDFEILAARPRPVIRSCVDWSEQRHHLAGGLGAALAQRMFDLGWVDRVRRGRAVRITDAGAAGLREQFGVVITA